jgi:type VI protein secretion system component Hcp
LFLGIKRIVFVFYIYISKNYCRVDNNHLFQKASTKKYKTMRIILIALLLLSASLCFSQAAGVYLNLTTPGGTKINGTSQLIGYEKWIQSQTFSTGGRNNTQIDFTMEISGASADLMNVMNSGAMLPLGQINALDYSGSGKPRIVYTITMENIRVLSCRDIMGCNNILTTSVQLQATRIGWTYYEVTPDGRTVISRKYGYDAETKQQWLKF